MKWSCWHAGGSISEVTSPGAEPMTRTEPDLVAAAELPAGRRPPIGIQTFPRYKGMTCSGGDSQHAERACLILDHRPRVEPARFRRGSPRPPMRQRARDPCAGGVRALVQGTEGRAGEIGEARREAA